MIKDKLPFDHPCFCNTCVDVSRMHLAVAPLCNIKCNFCTPTVSDCLHGCIPGVCAKVLNPQEALEWVREVREEKKIDIQIVGIAGPGEPLFNQETFESLRLVKKAYPDMHLCLSTNGLLLPQCIDEICSVGVKTITVTVNAATYETGARIYERVINLEGTEASKCLIDAQREGIRMAVASGLFVKINTVLVPGINHKEINIIAKQMRDLGAYIHNVLPLIPRDKFADKKKPDTYMVKKAREEAGQYLEQFTQCDHCRADAVVAAKNKRYKHIC